MATSRTRAARVARLPQPLSSHAAGIAVALPKLRPVAIAVQCALALGCANMLGIAALPQAAHAQAQGQTASGARSIQIGAGPLAQVLNTFARSAGVELTVDDALLQGKPSGGLKGNYTTAGGFAALLQGTGLEAVRQGNGSYAVQQSQELPEVTVTAALQATASSTSTTSTSTDTLPEVVVTAAPLDGVTENSGSYTIGATSVATKMATSLKETPRSVSVMTNQQLKDQGLEGKNLEEALRYAPGITLDDTPQGFVEFGSDNSMPRIYSRGQQVTNIQVDGLTYDLAGANGSTSFNQGDYYNQRATGLLRLPDMVLFDHVEIVRGPNSVFSGNGTPSATINMVRKRPMKDYQLVGELNGSSWSNNSGHIGGRGTFDVTGTLPILEGRLRGRFLASKADGAASFQDHHKSERETFYAALEADLAPDTVVGINASKEKINSTGIPVSGGLPRYHWGGDLGLPVGSNITAHETYSNSRTETYQAYLKHEFNDSWKLNANVAHTSQHAISHIMMWDSSNVYEDGNGARLSFRAAPFNKKISQDNVDIHVNGDFQLLERNASVLVGLDMKKLDGAYVPGYRASPRIVREINILNYQGWNDSYLEGNLLGNYLFSNIETQRENGIYAALRVNIIDPVNLIVSGRRASYQNKSIGHNLVAPSEAYTSDTGRVTLPVTPTYAVTYDINKDITAYISHSRSYQDQSSLRKGTLLDPENPWSSSSYIVGDTLKPAIGKNWEFGVNGEFLNGRINANATLFHMKRTSIANSLGYGGKGSMDSDWDYTACCYDNSGEQESKGVDLGASGEIYPGIQLSAGYTFNKNETKSGFGTSTASGAAGIKTHTRSPEHQLKIWTGYKPHGVLSNWNFGAGIVAQSKAYSSGTAAEYLGYDPDRIFTNAVGEVIKVGGDVYSNDTYYTTGAGAGLGYNTRGETWTLPYDFSQKPYAVFGLSAGYQFTRNWYAQLNVDNVFNKRYYRTIGTSTYGNYYGAPRSYTFVLRGTFD